MKNGMRPIHPGEILREEFLVPLKLSCASFARTLRVPTNRVTTIVAEKRDVTADTAIRLSRALGTTAEFWLGMQQAYDLRVAEEAGAGKSVRPIAMPAAVA
jgi:addiction module HigA family antidote